MIWATMDPRAAGATAISHLSIRIDGMNENHGANVSENSGSVIEHYSNSTSKFFENEIKDVISGKRLKLVRGF